MDHVSIRFMLSTNEAIVLSLQPHSDRAHILHAYTRASGRVNYMVYGLGKKKGAGIYTPLSLVQITADHNSKGPLSIRTAQLSFVPKSVPFQPYKQSIALFLGEVLFLTLRHPMEDETMFDYIADSIRLLDETDEAQELANFHLQFLIGFASHLGFGIDEKEHPQLVRVPHSRSERQEQLRMLCDYFAEHIDSWQTPKSLDVLSEIFD